jgi:hypothetical protein
MASREEFMTGPIIRCFAAALAFGLSPAAMSHGCEPVDRYLVGHYHGDCDSQTELAQGQGEAKGADHYVGAWFQGKPEGKGVYRWENGARLEGTFKDGKAEGVGLYVSAGGGRYPGPFVAGIARGLKAADCPSTPGPLTCAAASQ